jgi:hypothetical protein
MRKQRGLDVEEKRELYHRTIETLPDLVYNKPVINDRRINFDYLRNPSHFKAGN